MKLSIIKMITNSILTFRLKYHSERHFSSVNSYRYAIKKGKDIPFTGHESPLEDVDARVHIYAATALILFGAELTPGSVLTQCMVGSPCELSEELVTQKKRKKGWRMNSDVGEATEGLENEL